MNRLANLKNNPVVRAAIQRDKDIKRTKKSPAMGSGIASLLIPGGCFAKLGGKDIGQAFKLAGSIGNTKKADTVGNRIKQSQAIMGKSPKDKPFPNRTSMSTQYNKTASTQNPMLGTLAGTSASTKYYRTLTNAIEQGPSKVFISGRNAKTGITSNKRNKTGNISQRQENKNADLVRMRVDDDRDIPFFDNRNLLKQTLLSNKKAREALRKK